MNIEGIRERYEKASTGAWSRHDTSDYVEIHNSDTWGKALSPIALVGHSEDAEFIAHSREDIPYLIGEIHDLIDKLERYRQLECDERLIKLPIRPGTTVWVLERKLGSLRYDFVRERLVNSYGISTDGYMNMQLMVPEEVYPYPVDDIYLEPSQIGKRVFPAKAEAETALARQ